MMIPFAELPGVSIFLPGLLFFILCWQLYYYLRYYMQPLYRIHAEKNHRIHYDTTQPPVSVIVYANNESELLAANLPAFLEQNYPEFEVIVVNDGSSDESEEVLSDFEKRYSNLYHTFLAEGARNLSRRKLSLTLGIKAARYDIVLLTNANCRPASSDWIKNMARNFTDKTQLVMGYTRFEKRKGLGERFIAFDLLLRSLRIFGYALASKPYTGDGTNLAYRKSLFFEHKGFARYMHLHVGDDDLFINQVATRRNTKVELSEQATIIADYEHNGEGWRYLKRNNAFTASFYHSWAKWVFGTETSTRYLFYITAIGGAVILRSNHTALGIIGILLIIKLVLQGVFWYQAGKQLNTRRFIFCIPFFELTIPIVNLLFRISSFLHRKQNYTWKI